jgi:hypothetical protein
MRLSMGISYLSLKDTYMGMDETVSGAGMAMNLAFGAAVAPNLVIFGEMTVSSALEPNYEGGGTSAQMNSVNVSMVGIGPGIAYYLEGPNLYLSGSLSFPQVSVDNNSSSSSDSTEVTEFGIGTNLLVGKEWWVSSNWGLGIAGMFQIASMKMKDYDDRMSAFATSVLFSATYN